MKNYPRPPYAGRNNEMITQRLQDVADAGAGAETVTIDWRGQPTHLPVIQLQVGHLYYNPATHRIRAQRPYDPGNDSLLSTDPWSAEAQEYLERLLKATPANPAVEDPEFRELRDSLEKYNQTDPGLVTRDGVLVNGNTRRAAIIEMFGPNHNMRVAVLPASCDWDDISAVELSLQLRKDHRRDYSYINRLLAVEEMASQGNDVGVIAAAFRSNRPTIEQEIWILNALHDLIERSRSGDSKLALIAFEEHKEKLRELHRAYSKELKSNPDKAELLKENRLAAIALGFAKTEVRVIEPNFRRRYLDAELKAAGIKVASAPEAAEVSIPGLGRSVRSGSSEVAAARSFTDKILRAKAKASAIGAESGNRAAASEIDLYRKATKNALEPASKDVRVRKKKQLASSRIESASRDIRQCTQDIVLSRASRALDEDALDDALASLKESLEELADQAGRTIFVPGDGVRWLLQAFGKGV